MNFPYEKLSLAYKGSPCWKIMSQPIMLTDIFCYFQKFIFEDKSLNVVLLNNKLLLNLQKFTSNTNKKTSFRVKKIICTKFSNNLINVKECFELSPYF